MLLRRWFPLLSFCLSVQALALDIPQNLNQSERKEMMRMFGLSTSTKMLTNPYPLGGYPGLEVGVAMEIVNTLDLGRWGSKSNQQAEFRYPRFSIGKGLYHNIDLFFQFTPFGENSQLTQYGGMVKWTFYQSKFLPVTLSTLAHVNTINLNDSFVAETVGFELVAGINVDSFALYFGGGPGQTYATFMSGAGTKAIVNPADPAVNANTNTVVESIQETRTFVGVSIHILDFFAAIQIDNHRDPVYSAKIGMRF